MKKILLYTLGLLLFSVMSCTEEAEVWDSSTLDHAGDWWVDHSLGTTGYATATLQTFNTAADDGKEIWISYTSTSPKTYKVKCPINKENLTFGGADLANTLKAYKVTIQEGKIMKNAAHSPSGAVVDSIYYKVSFSDFPGNVYEVKGIMKTGFEEDAH